jgi:hypothetical protein
MTAVDEIRQLYNTATKATIQRDLTRAIALLKTLETESERERVAVYMDGLSQMRSEWGVRPASPAGKSGAVRKAGAAKKRPAAGRGAVTRRPAKAR